MRYLIISQTNKFTPFLTHWYDYENNYVPFMTVFDLTEFKYTTNGKEWLDIEEDHL